jgi:hypothetical protein
MEQDMKYTVESGATDTRRYTTHHCRTLREARALAMRLCRANGQHAAAWLGGLHAASVWNSDAAVGGCDDTDDTCRTTYAAIVYLAADRAAERASWRDD